MPENRQFMRINPPHRKGHQPEQTPFAGEGSYGNALPGSPPLAGPSPAQYADTTKRREPGKSQYGRFVDDHVRAYLSDQETLPLNKPLDPIGYYGPQAGSIPAIQAAAPLSQAPDSTAIPPKKRSHNQKTRSRRIPIWVRVVLSMLAVLLLALGGAAAYLYFTLSNPLSHIVGQQVTRSRGEADPNQGHTGGILDNGRINILLLGSDTDYKTIKINGGALAQVDIVVTIDPATKAVGMLSIPRDFWINIPGYGMHKLDEAYLLGGGGAGGIRLSRLTIEQDFGIPINYYAWVGLDGFVKVIDTVGGVDVDVLHPITDDNYPDDVGTSAGDPYALKRLFIAPGPQHLTGTQALEYVRSRHADLVGDFGRSARQQQVLGQLKVKLYNRSIISKLPDLVHDLDGYVTTDLQLNQVIALTNFARTVDQNKIARVILGPPYSQVDTLPDGTSIVTPFCDKIQPEIAQFFVLGNKARCDIQAHSGVSSSPVASVPQTSSSLLLADLYGSGANDLWQALRQTVSTSAQSPTGSANDFLGIHSLLDLVFMVVFDLQNGWQT